jgi:hypothetical protein
MFGGLGESIENSVTNYYNGNTRNDSHADTVIRNDSSGYRGSSNGARSNVEPQTKVSAPAADAPVITQSVRRPQALQSSKVVSTIRTAREVMQNNEVLRIMHAVRDTGRNNNENDKMRFDNLDGNIATFSTTNNHATTLGAASKLIERTNSKLIKNNSLQPYSVSTASEFVENESTYSHMLGPGEKESYGIRQSRPKRRVNFHFMIEGREIGTTSIDDLDAAFEGRA